MRKKQRLVAVRVSLGLGAPGPPIELVGGESLEELLATWRIVQMQRLGEESGTDGHYAALLLLEEAAGEGSAAPLGFAVR
ncbi:MAG TPA: hypothetical protein VHR45_05630 [Thermoanaerobaculia bacterium]|nr:hypothetical protein [Thermoanaerobaculia bacterium]